MVSLKPMYEFGISDLFNGEVLNLVRSAFQDRTFLGLHNGIILGIISSEPAGISIIRGRGIHHNLLKCFQIRSIPKQIFNTLGQAKYTLARADFQPPGNLNISELHVTFFTGDMRLFSHGPHRVCFLQPFFYIVVFPPVLLDYYF